MKKTVGKLMAMCVLTVSVAAFAQSGDAMKQDDKKQDSMKNDNMKNDNMKNVLKGWISDSDCAAHGDKMCGNKEHIAKGAKLVFVTEGDNTILTVSNPSTVADHQGHHVQTKGITNSEKSTITVQQVKMLK